jgi:hypothetical protein
MTQLRVDADPVAGVNVVLLGLVGVTSFQGLSGGEETGLSEGDGLKSSAEDLSTVSHGLIPPRLAA